jgi:hypothetical protein
MSYAYRYCTNLTTAVCGPHVTDMHATYYNCINLTTAACGQNVTNMYSAYQGCTNLITPACGPNVTNMSNAYRDCKNLTTAACGPNVTSMMNAYRNCTNLTTAACGPYVINMYMAYANTSARGNCYLYSNSIRDVKGCFENRRVTDKLNIYVCSGTATNTAVHFMNSSSLVNKAITWTYADDYQYNATYGIYIYPVANVEAARLANGD